MIPYIPHVWAVDPDEMWIFDMLGILGWPFWLVGEVLDFFKHQLDYFYEAIGHGLPVAPDGFQSLCGDFIAAATYVSPVAAWVPWSYLPIALGFTMVGLFSGVLLRVVLKIISVIRGAGL